MIWTSNIDGEIETGASFSFPFSVGTHTITASVTDSGGLKASSSIVLEVQSSMQHLYFAQFGNGETTEMGVLWSVPPPAAPDHSDRKLGSQSSFRSLTTNGSEKLLTGSVTVSADQPVDGFILFGGTIGSAGVGNSAALSSGFLAPLDNDQLRGIRVGIAVMNLEDRETNLTLHLLDKNGAQGATRSNLTLGSKGHIARFLDELFPVADFPGLDLSNFQGLLEVDSEGAVAATVIQTRPGQFATLPVIPK